MAELNFDSEGIEPNQPFSVLPPGEYIAEISDSEMQDTKAGTGQFLKLEFTILASEDDQGIGRKLFDRLNIVNPNKQAEDIARRTLSAICHSVGVLKVGDSSELHNRPLKLIVGIEKRKDNGEDTNRIMGYASAGPATTPAAKPAPAPAKPAAAAPKAAPWAKRAA